MWLLRFLNRRIIDAPRTRPLLAPDKPDEFFAKPSAIAEEMYRVAHQDRSAWSFRGRIASLRRSLVDWMPIEWAAHRAKLPLAASRNQVALALPSTAPLICRDPDAGLWVLEVVNHENASAVSDGTFDTNWEAWPGVMRTIQQEGIALHCRLYGGRAVTKPLIQMTGPLCVTNAKL